MRFKQNRYLKFYKSITNCMLWVIIGLSVCFIGGTMNFKTVLENDCKMPVWTDHNINMSNTHFSFNDFDSVNYSYFSDYLPLFSYDIGLFSIGDFLIVFGIFVCIFSLIFMCFDLFDLYMGEKYEKTDLGKEM